MYVFKMDVVKPNTPGIIMVTAMIAATLGKSSLCVKTYRVLKRGEGADTASVCMKKLHGFDGDVIGEIAIWWIIGVTSRHQDH